MEEIVSGKSSKEGEKTQCERTTVFQVASSGLVWPEFVGTIRCTNYD